MTCSVLRGSGLCVLVSCPWLLGKSWEVGQQDWQMVSDERSQEELILPCVQTIHGNVDLREWSAGPVAHVAWFTSAMICVKKHPPPFSADLGPLPRALPKWEWLNVNFWSTVTFIGFRNIFVCQIRASKYKLQNCHPVTLCHGYNFGRSRTEHPIFI